MKTLIKNPANIAVILIIAVAVIGFILGGYHVMAGHFNPYLMP